MVFSGKRARCVGVDRHGHHLESGVGRKEPEQRRSDCFLVVRDEDFDVLFRHHTSPGGRGAEALDTRAEKGARDCSIFTGLAGRP